MAHGAGEEEDGGIARLGWAQAAAYIVVGIAVAGLFLALPLAGLVLFLALSAWHFARSDCRMGQAARLAIAALAIGGSALFQPQTTAQVFTAAMGEPAPVLLVRLLALAGVAGAGAALYALFRNQRGCGEAMLALGATALLHPVLAVGLVFLLGHALPIQRRQLRRYGSAAVTRAVLWPTLLAIAGAALLAAGVLSGWLALPVAAALAFGLATPHMLTDRLER